jgi:hypothetical protein
MSQTQWLESNFVIATEHDYLNSILTCSTDASKQLGETTCTGLSPACSHVYPINDTQETVSFLVSHFASLQKELYLKFLSITYCI